MSISQSLEQLYKEQHSSLANGFWDRSVISDSSKRMSKVARRLLKSTWKTNIELSPKNRKGIKQVQDVTAHLQWLIKIGFAKKAWDNNGDVFYAKHAEPLPVWLTQSVYDSDLIILPCRSTCDKDEIS